MSEYYVSELDRLRQLPCVGNMGEIKNGFTLNDCEKCELKSDCFSSQDKHGWVGKNARKRVRRIVKTFRLDKDENM